MLIVIIYKPAECLYGLICQYVLCTTGILVCCFFAYTDELQKLADGMMSVQIFVAFGCRMGSVVSLHFSGMDRCNPFPTSASGWRSRSFLSCQNAEISAVLLPGCSSCSADIGIPVCRLPVRLWNKAIAQSGCPLLTFSPWFLLIVLTRLPCT